MKVIRGIKKIPFNGKGKNLIDFFCIIGYEEKYIEEVICFNYPKQLIYDPVIISSITSEEAETVFDENKLIKINYPSIPEITDSIFLKDKVSNIIFSFPISNAKGTSQNIVCGFSKLFYEQFNSNYLKKTIYLPKAFTIVSKFPYFTTFNLICNNVLVYFQNSQIANKYPVELVLYLIINYTPSPLSFELNLELFPNREGNELKSLLLPQLSGYPFIDFNMSKLFNLLPLNFVIEVFIFTLLEVDMFFFSENLELLNIVMYIFYALNYPLNDSMNFWHIFSLSKKDLIEKLKPQFINTILSKCIIFLGVNTKYEDTIEIPQQFINYSLIDLNSKKIIHKGEGKSIDDREKIGKYIQKCIKGKASSSFMQNMILDLVNNINSVNIEQSRMSLVFNTQKMQQALKFFEFNQEINENNRKIQESFYEVIIGLLKKFYNDHKISFDVNSNSNSNTSNCEIESLSDKEVYNINYDLFKLNYAPDDAKCDQAELLIIDLFKQSTKFDNYFRNYLYDFSSSDNYLIPLMFSEEFINLNLSSTTEINKDNVNKFYFDVIDNFYYDSNDNNDSLIVNQNKISYASFCKAVKAEVQYLTYAVDSEPKIAQKKSLRISIRTSQPEVASNTYFKFIKLNRKALMRTIDFCNNIEDNIKQKLIPSEILKTTNVINDSLSLKLIHSIEDTMIELNLVHIDDILLNSMFFLFLVTNLEISFYDSIVFFNHLTFQLVSRQYFMRKYIHYVLLAFYSLISSEKFDGKDVNITQRINMFYTLIISISNNNQIFPNEELTQLMLSLKNKLMKSSSQIILDDSISNMKTNDASFFIAAIDKNNKEINSKVLIEAVKRNVNSCNVEINNTERDSLRDEIKIKFSIDTNTNTDVDEGSDTKNDSKELTKQKDHNTIQLTHLYSPVKLKQKCEDLCKAYMKSCCIYKTFIETVTDFDDIIINIIYYSTISTDLKFFTSFFIKVFQLNKPNTN